MRVAIISDIHGNLEALQTVLDHIKTQNVDEIICLGDVIGYGANPNECAETVRAVCKGTVAGNHDFAVTDKTDISYFNPFAKQAVLWTREQLKPENFHFIANLPLHIYEDERIYVHATPSNPAAWGYIMSNLEALKEFSFFARKVCFIGHSHYPVVIEYKDTRCQFIRPSEVHFEPEKRYIINVGSVGQPRDGDPRAGYVVYDAATKCVQYHRLDYDMAATQRKIREAGLPEVLAERLALGK